MKWKNQLAILLYMLSVIPCLIVVITNNTFSNSAIIAVIITYFIQFYAVYLLCKKGKREMSDYPWVLWIKISIRKDWFTHLWYTRGANACDIQLWKIRIQIGLPWIKDAVISNFRDYRTDKTMMSANTGIYQNTFFSMVIGRYAKYYKSEEYEKMKTMLLL